MKNNIGFIIQLSSIIKNWTGKNLRGSIKPSSNLLKYWAVTSICLFWHHVEADKAYPSDIFKGATEITAN